MRVDPEVLTPDTQPENRTTASRQILAPKTLLLFATLGPLVAAIGLGGSSAGKEMFFAVLPLTYMIGFGFAFFAWLIYSAQFALLGLLDEKGLMPEALRSPLGCMCLGGVAGAIANLIAWGGPWCAGRVHYGETWGGCTADLFTKGFGASVAPGLVCGFVSVLLWHNSEA